MGKSQHEAKITEQDLVVAPQQQVLRLEIAMNEVGIVCILQGGRDLLDVADNGAEGSTCPLWITLPFLALFLSSTWVMKISYQIQLMSKL